MLVADERGGDSELHVLVPVAEYERMRDALERCELLERLSAPASEYVDDKAAALIIAGGELAAARRRAGLTQRQLGERLGVPQSQISRIERDPDRSTIRTMKRIAAALGVDVASLLPRAAPGGR
ncbi:MAG: helix-turn-helix domain-containing protein [Phycisphaerae bacterium]